MSRFFKSFPMRNTESQLIPIVNLNPVMLPREKPTYQRPEKPVHVDPRALPKRSGFGRGNWGTIKDAIDQGYLEFYSSKQL
jgi:hypothetical protein